MRSIPCPCLTGGAALYLGAAPAGAADLQRRDRPARPASSPPARRSPPTAGWETSSSPIAEVFLEPLRRRARSWGARWRTRSVALSPLSFTRALRPPAQLPGATQTGTAFTIGARTGGTNFHNDAITLSGGLRRTGRRSQPVMALGAPQRRPRSCSTLDLGPGSPISAANQSPSVSPHTGTLG